MPRAHRTYKAIADLEHITDYIRRNDPRAARAFVDASEQAISFLADTPHGGSVWEGGGESDIEVRFWPIPRYPNYVIFYRLIDDGIEVVRVIHAARDLESVLGE